MELETGTPPVLVADEQADQDDAGVAKGMPPKRTQSFTLTPEQHDKLVDKLLTYYIQDIADRRDWSEKRLQRYAKYRGWLEPKHYPWPDASNAFVPLMMTDSQQMQDTLHNGVLSQRPVMAPQAMNPADKDKAETVADLLDYQFFLEQKGEEKLSTLIESYVNDGTMYSLQAWVDDKQDTEQIQFFPPLQQGMGAPIVNYQLRQLLEGLFSDQKNVVFDLASEKDPFKWTADWLDENQQDKHATIQFFTHNDGRLMAVIKKEITIFSGPCVIPKSEEDVVYPSRAENLQPPSPSNPMGAHHVALVDYPSRDEILRLIESGYYDNVTEEQEELFEKGIMGRGGNPLSTGDDPQQHKVQRDALAGNTFGNAEVAHHVYTRLLYFVRYDIDGDGLDENMVFWVIKEPRIIVRARLQQEVFPSEDGSRPLMSKAMIPVPGQIRGIGLLELLEHLQDMIKILVDQTIDKNTMVNTPSFFFRATSGVRPEAIRLGPGEGYPVGNPQQDISFMQIPNADQSTSLNLMSIFNQWAERQAVIGEMQFGRVPQGKSSALRTTGGMMAVLQQGSARPERLIRRFFSGLAEIWQQMHQLNNVFLPPKKQYRILGMSTPGADPYRQLDDPSKIHGKFQFEFKANSLNTQKAVKGQILQQLGAMTFNPMTMQMGLVTPDNFYNWLKDIYSENGQDPNRYLNPPSPASAMPKISAEQAMGLLYQGVIPEQMPAEGPQVHLQRLQQLYTQLQQENAIDQAFTTIYKVYAQKVQGYAMQAQQMAQAAGQFAGMLGGGGSGGQGQGQGGGQEAGMQPPGQLMDESLPGAGGGANPGMGGM